MQMCATEALLRLVDFACTKGLVEEEDRLYAINRLLETMEMDAPEELPALSKEQIPETATRYLAVLCEDAANRGLFEDSPARRDLFSEKLMGVLTPHPAMVREAFRKLYTEDGAAAATSRFYQMCRACDYIKVDRIAKNARFFEDTPAGRLEITINLSKPEKNPRTSPHFCRSSRWAIPSVCCAWKIPGTRAD